MTAESVSVIDLPHWESGKRRIRFLYLAANNSFRVTKQCTNEEQMIPLFLGADLFSNTDVRTENHPRYHAKFAKKGLATKLVFSSFRFQGIRLPCSSNSLWFYCIHGVFRVAFELYSKQEQLSVLESFQDVWRARINDEQLNMVYNLDVQLDTPVPEIIEKEMPKTDEIFALASAHSPSQETEENSVASQPEDSSADHDYCFLSEQVNSQHCSELVEKVCSIGDKVKSTSTMGVKQKETVLKLLDYTECLIGGQQDEERLTEAVLALLRNHSPEFSIYSSPLLRALASWLGQTFHVANSNISQQVEGFKMRHIEHITDLPPAEELATELFPEAMRNLLINWMGLSDEAATWKRLSEYPIVLLILEFANHNLITGVAHVLYSSLISR
uniref:Si:ch211-110p13.9 n=1 Tax=Astyanax mexicanus TaxID=7994 RepID=A0A3B1II97_ASTMX